MYDYNHNGNKKQAKEPVPTWSQLWFLTTVPRCQSPFHCLVEKEGVCQGCVLSPCLFNLYAEYIIRNAGLDEAQAGIKIAGRNISNLRYADDTNLMAESKEELKSLLRKVKKTYRAS